MRQKRLQVIFSPLFLFFVVFPAQVRAMDSEQKYFYEINFINNIDIIFAADDWDRTLFRFYAAGEEERLVGTALINGVRFDSVGVRYKGNSSYRPI